MEQKMEYMILSVHTANVVATEESINHFAQQGWIVICALSDYRILMGRECKKYELPRGKNE
jgi:hypothetical protein